MKSFLVWCPEWGYSRDDAQKVKAEDHEAAAESWAERSDQEGDYTIAGGRSLDVLVAEEESKEVPRKFNLTAEPSVTYYAHEDTAR